MISLLTSLSCLLAAACVALMVLYRHRGLHVKELQDRLREQSEAHERAMQQTRADLRAEAELQARAIAAQMLQEQSQMLLTQSSRSLEAIVRPLQEKFGDLRATLQESHMQDTAGRQSLNDRLDRLMQDSRTISREAHGLTQALRGNTRMQGAWGETLLTRLLEHTGMLPGVHYTLQATHDTKGAPLKDDEGRRQRPDAIVHLPGDRHLIIDAKASLTAYLATSTASDDEARSLLRDHVAAVRRHIDQLSARRYPDSLEGALPYVVMFVPSDGAMLAATGADDTLLEYAIEHGIVLTSPGLLPAILLIAGRLWQQESRDRHTLQIADKGGSLHDKAMLFLSSMEDIGSALERSRKAYDTAMLRLVQGRGSIASVSRELKNMGVKARKQMPPATAQLLELEDEQTPDNDAFSE